MKALNKGFDWISDFIQCNVLLPCGMCQHSNYSSSVFWGRVCSLLIIFIWVVKQTPGDLLNNSTGRWGFPGLSERRCLKWASSRYWEILRSYLLILKDTAAIYNKQQHMVEPQPVKSCCKNRFLICISWVCFFSFRVKMNSVSVFKKAVLVFSVFLTCLAYWWIGLIGKKDTFWKTAKHSKLPSPGPCW